MSVADLDPTSQPTSDQSPAEPAAAGTVPPVARSGRLALPFRVAILAVILLAGGTLFMSGYSIGRSAATTPGTPVSEERAFQPFWDTYRAITDHYAGGDVDRKAVIDGAIKGMIDALGHHVQAGRVKFCAAAAADRRQAGWRQDRRCEV